MGVHSSACLCQISNPFYLIPRSESINLAGCLFRRRYKQQQGITCIRGCLLHVCRPVKCPGVPVCSGGVLFSVRRAKIEGADLLKMKKKGCLQYLFFIFLSIHSGFLFLCLMKTIPSPNTQNWYVHLALSTYEGTTRALKYHNRRFLLSPVPLSTLDFLMFTGQEHEL